MDSRDGGGAGGSPSECVYCGATDELVPDDYLEDLFYCRTCLEKHLRHGQQIEERGEADPRFDG